MATTRPSLRSFFRTHVESLRAWAFARTNYCHLSPLHYAADSSRGDGNWRHCEALTRAGATRRITGSFREPNLSITQTLSWTEWQQTVLALIRRDFSEVLQEVGEQDVDWDAWRPLYDQGLSPRQAVAEAFLLPAA